MIFRLPIGVGSCTSNMKPVESRIFPVTKKLKTGIKNCIIRSMPRWLQINTCLLTRWNPCITPSMTSWLLLGAVFPTQLFYSSHAAVVIGLQTSTIGHAILDPNPPFFPDRVPRSVGDYLIDQDQSSGGG